MLILPRQSLIFFKQRKIFLFPDSLSYIQGLGFPRGNLRSKRWSKESVQYFHFLSIPCFGDPPHLAEGLHFSYSSFVIDVLKLIFLFLLFFARYNSNRALDFLPDVGEEYSVIERWIWSINCIIWIVNILNHVWYESRSKFYHIFSLNFKIMFSFNFKGTSHVNFFSVTFKIAFTKNYCGTILTVSFPTGHFYKAVKNSKH